MCDFSILSNISVIFFLSSIQLLLRFFIIQNLDYPWAWKLHFFWACEEICINWNSIYTMVTTTQIKCTILLVEAWYRFSVILYVLFVMRVWEILVGNKKHSSYSGLENYFSDDFVFTFGPQCGDINFKLGILRDNKLSIFIYNFRVILKRFLIQTRLFLAIEMKSI